MNVTENLNWRVHVRSLCASLGKIYYIIKSLKDEILYSTNDLFCLLSVVNVMWYNIQGEGQG